MRSPPAQTHFLISWFPAPPAALIPLPCTSCPSQGHPSSTPASDHSPIKQSNHGCPLAASPSAVCLFGLSSPFLPNLHNIWVSNLEFFASCIVSHTLAGVMGSAAIPVVLFIYKNLQKWHKSPNSLGILGHLQVTNGHDNFPAFSFSDCEFHWREIPLC